MKTNRQILEDRGVNVNELGADKPILLYNIMRAMDDFADQYHAWKKANEAKTSDESAEVCSCIGFNGMYMKTTTCCSKCDKEIKTIKQP